MRDEQTGSWWQQITGEAIQGSFKGKKLTPVDMDELTFGLWKLENPNGVVLRPDPAILALQKYERADWETQVGKMPVTTSAAVDNALEPRALIVGVSVNGKAKAYPFASLVDQSPILDAVGGMEIVLVVAEDGKSVRGFDRMINQQKLEFLKDADSDYLIDAETGSKWDFSGHAVSGELSGSQLDRVAVIKDYWFDWKTYHPDTQLYLR
jgi:uncharacterized protein DUF3179